MLNTAPRKVPHWWTQKVLPLVYDDSLSYYEVLGKLIHKINEVIGYVTDNIEELVSYVVSEYFTRITYDSETETIHLDLTGGDS